MLVWSHCLSRLQIYWSPVGPGFFQFFFFQFFFSQKQIVKFFNVKHNLFGEKFYWNFIEISSWNKGIETCFVEQCFVATNEFNQKFVSTKAFEEIEVCLVCLTRYIIGHRYSVFNGKMPKKYFQKTFGISYIYK